MQIFATELGAWAVLGTFLMTAVTAISLISHVIRVKRSNLLDTAEDWKKNSEANEARVKVLEAEIAELKVLAADSRKEVFNMSVLVADLKRDNTRLGLRELDQQRQIDRLARRERQLVSAIEGLGGIVPDALKDDF
jgi:hypothetical protein